MLISAIIPTYNRGPFLKDAVLSVIEQNHPVDECIIVDDGSTDNSQEIIKQLVVSSKIPLSTVYQENKGPAAARNKGVQLARGQYIAFLDSDDRWERKKIELQLSAHQKLPNHPISHTAERWLRRGAHLNKKKKHHPQSGEIFYQNLKLCAVGMSTVMVKQEVFKTYGMFDESFPCCEDYEFWLRVSLHEPFLLVDKELTIKNGGREDQVSWKHRIGMDVHRIRALEKIIDLSEKHDKSKYDAACQEAYIKCQIYAKGCLKHGKPLDAQYYFDKAQRILPGKKE